ncbi:Zinc finger protein 76, partial [Globisporangium polare]
MSTTFASLPPLANALPLRPPPAPVTVPTTSTTTGHRFREPSQDRPFLCPFPSCAGRFHR